METYDISAARILTDDGTEILVISIPPEHYQNPPILARYIASLGRLDLPLVIVSPTSEKEWSIRPPNHLTEAVKSLQADSLQWHRMPVTSEIVPWEL